MRLSKITFTNDTVPIETLSTPYDCIANSGGRLVQSADFSSNRPCHHVLWPDSMLNWQSEAGYDFVSHTRYGMYMLDEQDTTADGETVVDVLYAGRFTGVYVVVGTDLGISDAIDFANEHYVLHKQALRDKAEAAETIGQ